LPHGKPKPHIGGHLSLPRNKSYCIVGDLHGRIDTLEKIVSKSPDLHHVLIGDSIHHKPFFKRTKKTSPVRTLEYVKRRCEEDKMTLLLGNNENYILENLVTLEDKILKKETRYTLTCLRELDFDSRLGLISWLARCPLTATIKSNKKTYRLGHGLYYDKVTKHNRDRILSGPGYPWWKDTLEEFCPNKKEIYIHGHYGYPYMRKNLRIIDATNFEGVGLYYVDRDEFLIHY